LIAVPAKAKQCESRLVLNPASFGMTESVHTPTILVALGFNVYDIEKIRKILQ
jgi:hypothetical protein